MTINGSVGRNPVSVAETQLSRVTESGIVRHAHLAALVEGRGAHTGRDLADAIHLLCSVHGHHPGLIELAFSKCGGDAASEWLGRASEAFERERLYLVRLTSAVGPLPSTPGA